MVQKFINLKYKILKLLQLHYVQEIFQKIGQQIKTGFNGYVYNFSGDYDAIAVGGILDIHEYLMKKNNIV